MSVGGIIGGANIPTTVAAPGIWRPGFIARQIAGKASGLKWPGPADPSFSSVTYLSHMNELDSSGNMTDKSSAGNHAALASRGTGGSIAFGAGYFTGEGAIINPGTGQLTALKINTVSIAMGNGDFTVEGFVKFSSNASTQNIFDGRQTNSAVTCVQLLMTSSGKLAYYDGSAVQITGATTISTGAWHHVHATRASGTTYLGMDGAQEGSDFTDSHNYTATWMWIGNVAAVGADQGVHGLVGAVRITKGVARYTRTYTVPTATFPDY